MAQTLRFKPITVRSKVIKNLSVELYWIGEGNSGDYDDTDPDDRPLLRFDVMYGGAQLEDASYCTALSLLDRRSLLTEAAKVILGEAELKTEVDRKGVPTGFHLKRAMERQSWLEVVNGKLNRRA